MKFGREEVLPWRGRKFTRILSLGGEFVLRIFSPPEEISGGRFYPVTPALDTSYVCEGADKGTTGYVQKSPRTQHYAHTVSPIFS